MSAHVARLDTLHQPLVGHARELAAGEAIRTHRHRRHQLIYASHGLMNVHTPGSAFLVPPQFGVWMPGGTDHRVEAHTRVSMRTVYLEPALTHPGLPAQACVVGVRPLLRELIVSLVQGPDEYPQDSVQGRLAAVILDELGQLPVTPLSLPVPHGSRIATVTAALLADPCDRRGLGEWAREFGISERTLSRRFVTATGMSFRAWRQQRRLIGALELLAAGHPVTRVALELGYEGTSAFSAMFRRSLGCAPSRFFAASAGAPRIR